MKTILQFILVGVLGLGAIVFVGLFTMSGVATSHDIIRVPVPRDSYLSGSAREGLFSVKRGIGAVYEPTRALGRGATERPSPQCLQASRARVGRSGRMKSTGQLQILIS